MLISLKSFAESAECRICINSQIIRQRSIRSVLLKVLSSLRATSTVLGPSFTLGDLYLCLFSLFKMRIVYVEILSIFELLL